MFSFPIQHGTDWLLTTSYFKVKFYNLTWTWLNQFEAHFQDWDNSSIQNERGTNLPKNVSHSSFWWGNS